MYNSKDTSRHNFTGLHILLVISLIIPVLFLLFFRVFKICQIKSSDEELLLNLILFSVSTAYFLLAIQKRKNYGGRLLRFLGFWAIGFSAILANRILFNKPLTKLDDILQDFWYEYWFLLYMLFGSLFLSLIAEKIFILTNKMVHHLLADFHDFFLSAEETVKKINIRLLFAVVLYGVLWGVFFYLGVLNPRNEDFISRNILFVLGYTGLCIMAVSVYYGFPKLSKSITDYPDGKVAKCLLLFSGIVLLFSFLYASSQIFQSAVTSIANALLIPVGIFGSIFGLFKFLPSSLVKLKQLIINLGIEPAHAAVAFGTVLVTLFVILPLCGISNLYENQQPIQLSSLKEYLELITAGLEFIKSLSS